MQKIVVLFFLFSFILNSELQKKEKVQREPYGLFDIQTNTKSNVSFKITNYGPLFFDFTTTYGSAWWPKRTLNQYLFGGGFWFGVQKFITSDSIINNGNGTYDTIPIRKSQKLVSISYDPNSANSWYVPGRIEVSDTLYTDDNWRNRVYFSTDFSADGTPKRPLDRFNWVLWDTNKEEHFGLGNYIFDHLDRNTTKFPEGPVYISDEDIFSTFKETDIRAYMDSMDIRKDMGYPLYLQVEQTLFTWENEAHKDMIIIFYKVMNKSDDTLFNCFAAPIYDPDLATAPNLSSGATNDFSRYYDEDELLNLSIAWTDTYQAESGEFGYLGISYVLTPAVDENNYLLSPKKYLNKNNQIGLTTYKNWEITEDVGTDDERYNFISEGFVNNSGKASDIRTILSSGPFNMLPGDTVYFATQLNFATTDLGGVATGEADDMQTLIQKVREGQNFFYANVLSKIDEFQLKTNDFDLFPNPADDLVEISSNFEGKCKIKVMDINGNLVYSQSKYLTKGQKIKINLDKFVSGIYLINIENNGIIVTKKLNVVK